MHWRNFLDGAFGIVYVVDASDPSIFEIAKNDIDNLVNNHYAQKSSIMLVFNKVDIIRDREANNTTVGPSTTQTSINNILIKMNISARTLTENNISTRLISLLTGEGFEDCLQAIYSNMNILAKRYSPK
jgi:50S ribosomal subunit-associated GTPase HflX